ncbi:MAG TPA: ABC transporter permease [Candidatus Limnocylindrales bacterium]|nr:ABC transporter permease [Candidatus Limnocylindrales bacterium]
MWQQAKELYFYREMLKNLVSKDLRSRYKGSILGFFWTFLNPLFMLIVYNLVFSYIMRIQMENFTMFLFVGLLSWSFISTSIIMGTSSLVDNGALLKKIYFPRVVLPLSIVITNLINYLLSLVILIPALLFFGVDLTLAVIALPVLLLVKAMFVASLVFLVAIANVFFRDLQHIVGIITMAWFFLTPVLYPIEQVPPQLRVFIYLNPATHIIESFRDIFFHGRWPQWIALGYLTLGLILLLVFSLYIFNHLQKSVAEEI